MLLSLRILLIRAVGWQMLLPLALTALLLAPTHAQNGPVPTNFITYSTGLRNHLVSSVYVEGNTIYAGTLDGLGVSTDGGQTFTTYTEGIPNSSVNKKEINDLAVANGKIYLATAGGVAISNDGGRTFTASRQGMGIPTMYCVAVLGSTIWTGGFDGLYVSDDEGQTYQKVFDGFFADVFITDGKIYTTLETGIGISSDGGATFYIYDNGLTETSINRIFAVGNTIYAATQTGVAISTNGGNSFTNHTRGLGNEWVNDVFALGTTVYAATVGGLSVSSDGGRTYRNITRGLATSSVGAVLANSTTVYAGLGGWPNPEGGLAIGALPPDVATGLSVASVTTSGATLTWNAVAGATHYVVRWRQSGSDAVSTQTVSTNSLTLTGLVTGGRYGWTVRPFRYGANAGEVSGPQFVTDVPAPANLRTSNVAANTATLAWDVAPGVGQYLVRWRPRNGEWQSQTVGSNSVDLTGLVAGQSYSWSVRAVGPDRSSATVAGRFFITQCPAPTNLTASNVAPTTVTLNWQGQGSSYVLRYNARPIPGWTTLTTTTPTADLSGLRADTPYQWQVRAVCPVVQSPFVVAPADFRTLPLSRGRLASPVTDVVAGELRLELMQNPVTGPTLEARVWSTDEEVLNVALYNMQGRVLQQQQIERPAQMQTIQLPFTVPAGMYLLRASTLTTSQTVKILRP